MILKNCTFFNEEFEKEFGDIKIENGRITEIGFFTEDGRDMSGKILLPGFVDIHIHGCAGGDFSDGTAEAFDKISAELAKHGVTSFCATTMTLPQERLKTICEVAEGYAAPKSKLVGVNLEGPYIAPAKKGAQNGEFVRPCSISEIDELTEICGKIKKELKNNNCNEESLVKIVLKGEVDAFCEKDGDYILKQFEDDYYFVKLYDETKLKVSYEDFKLDESLKGEFVRLVLARNDLPEDEKAEVIRYGINILSGEEV